MKLERDERNYILKLMIQEYTIRTLIHGWERDTNKEKQSTINEIISNYGYGEVNYLSMAAMYVHNIC